LNKDDIFDEEINKNDKSLNKTHSKGLNRTF